MADRIPGARERQYSTGLVEVLRQQIVRMPGLSSKKVWNATGKRLACRIVAESAGEQVQLNIPQTWVSYRVLFPENPQLDALNERLRVVKPDWIAGRILRIYPVTTGGTTGRHFTLIAREQSEDQPQTA
jgi:hypothetical protein